MKNYQHGSLALKKTTHEFIRISNPKESYFVRCLNLNTLISETLSLKDIQPISVNSIESELIGISKSNDPMNIYNTDIVLKPTNPEHYKKVLNNTLDIDQEELEQCKYIHEVQELVKGYSMLYFEILDE